MYSSYYHNSENNFIYPYFFGCFNKANRIKFTETLDSEYFNVELSFEERFPAIKV